MTWFIKPNPLVCNTNYNSRLLAPHAALAVIAFRYYSTTTLLPCIFQTFSSNLSKPITRGGIKWSLCRSNSLGTSNSTQGRDDSSSSSPLAPGLIEVECYKFHGILLP